MKDAFPTIGVIGPGPLARLSNAPATALGINLLILTSLTDDSGTQSLETVRAFAKECDVITFEQGVIPLSLVKTLEAEGVVVRPSSYSLLYSQDKSVIHENLKNHPNDSHSAQSFDCEIAVIVARSPHGQATSWAPTEIIRKDSVWRMTVAPAPHISFDLSQMAQKIALDIAAEAKAVGVLAVEFFVHDDQLLVKEVLMGPHFSGLWTVEGSRTTQFEQHLRAIFDLPLGDPSMTSPIVVTGNIVCGDKPDMYRPYLHLMARTPSLKFHQYKNEAFVGNQTGHLTLLGSDLQQLNHEVEHALDYMGAEIDE